MAPGSVKAKNGKRTKKTRKASTPAFAPELVIEWRRHRRLSQGEVAKRLEYDRTTISKMEHGQEPPAKFWSHFKKTFKGTDPRVDFYRFNGSSS